MNKQNKKPYTPPVANVMYYSEPLLTETSWGIEGDTGFGHKINEGNPGSIDARAPFSTMRMKTIHPKVCGVTNPECDPKMRNREDKMV